MEEDVVEKVPQLENDFTLCILCEENKQRSDVRKSPELSTFETLLCYIKDRHSFGDRKVYSIYNRLKEMEK